MKALLLFIVSTCAGCAIAPDYVRPEIQHESHVFQHMDHEPVHGRDVVALTAIWECKRTTIEVSEGYNFHGGEGVFQNSHAGREVFEMRVGYNFKVPK